MLLIQLVRFGFLLFITNLLLGCATKPIASPAVNSNGLAADSNLVEITPEEFHSRALRELPKQVTARQLSTWLKEKSVVLIDLRSAEDFKRAHLQGAINVPATELTDQVLKDRIPKLDSRIVVYCDDTLFPTRRVALTTLGHPTIQQLGYQNVFLLSPLYFDDECKSVGRPASFDSPCESLLPMQMSE